MMFRKDAGVEKRLRYKTSALRSDRRSLELPVKSDGMTDNAMLRGCSAPKLKTGKLFNIRIHSFIFWVCNRPTNSVFKKTRLLISLGPLSPIGCYSLFVDAYQCLYTGMKPDASMSERPSDAFRTSFSTVSVFWSQ